MRNGLKSIINRMLSLAGARAVSADWGPRGFASSFARLGRMGVRPGQIIDVGAASGEWTRECLGVFPESSYFLIDPLEENRAALQRLADERPKVKFHIGAAGAAPGKLVMHVHGDQSSFMNSAYADKAAGRTIEVCTLDSLLEQGAFAAPDLIKADVQGYELEVLKGAERCLRTAEVVLLEVSFRQLYAGSPLAHEVIAWMGARGFRIHDICTYSTRPRDNELFQADILFARAGSKAFAYEGYE